jgi:class 3 adenylate cyclase/tetratricopeptide (TPR) repeat protein
MPTCPACGQENPEIARFCLACATPLISTSPARQDAEERKVVSVLFCDMVGFTAASDRADPEDVRARLRPYHARVRQEIERFGGTMEKFIGDAVMAVFGAPVAHEDDAERAVRAGLRILEAIDELNAEQPGLGLAVRIGVNTGEAVVSLSAAQLEGESIVVGDVVNTASRLESIAPAGGVVVGEATYWTTRELFDYDALDPVTLKGKARPLSVWRVRAARRSARAYPEPLGLLPFLDRDDELELLARTFARTVRERSTQLVTVVGEPGVGKTRLVREFSQRTQAADPAVTWRYGRCLPYGEGITFWALGEIVKEQAGVLESDPPDEAGAKLAAAVERVVERPDERDWIYAGVSPLVGAPRQVPGAAPIEQGEVHATWRRFLESMAGAGPLALVFEDLHWADRAMLEFLEYLADWATDVPMLVVCTARPELHERRPGWGGGMRNSTTISLAPLGDDEIRDLVSALLPGLDPEAAATELVLERAGGNPLYAEEFARMITDRQLDPGSIAGIGAALPESIQAIIAARLDTLSAERKALLQDAAVVGRVFWSGAVASISGGDERTVGDHLHELARKELVRPARGSTIEGQGQYTFWHALIRDVAYAQIPRSARARKHRKMAEWISTVAGDRVADHAELLAHHYRQALDLAEAAGETNDVPRLSELAARSLELAGDRALGLDAARASQHYRRALDLLSEMSDRRAPLLVKAAEAATRTGAFEEAERSYEAAIEGLLAAGDVRAAGAAMVKLANLYWHRGQTAKNREMLDRAIAMLEREEPGPELALAYTEQANDKIVLGLYQEALHWAKRALALMDQLDVRDQAPSALSVQGMARWYMGDGTGVDDLKAALEMASDLGLWRDAARLQAILGEFLWVTEGPETGLAATEEAVKVAERRGNTDLAMAFRAERFPPLFDAGRWDELLSSADELTAWARSTGEGYFTIVASISKAHVQLCRGAVEEAAEQARAFLPAAREIEDAQVLVEALAVGALIERAAGRPDESLSLMEEFERSTRERPTWFRAKEIPELARACAAVGAVELAERLLDALPVHARRHQLSLLTARAVLEETRGDLEGALQHSIEAADGWRAFGHVLEVGWTELAAGRCLVQLGRSGSAEHLTEASAVFARLGAAPLLGEAETWISRVPADTSSPHAQT